MSHPAPQPTDAPSRLPWIATALVGFLFVLSGLGTSDSTGHLSQTPSHFGFAEAHARPAGPMSLADTAESSLAGVVNISSVRTAPEAPFSGSPFGSDPFFREFFKQWEGDGVPRERRQQSRGSGVIVRADGVVLTNNHVVEDATEITVTLSDGRNFPATILGTDPRTDLAVLQLEGVTDLSPLSFGDSTGLRLGEMVLAIGNPFGLEGTVTMGIVSAKGRADVGIVDYEDFIQTDAAINPGNSGGALVNTRGELVGINTAILSRSGGYQGIGFAIPSDMAKSIMESLLANGEVARGWLGVLIQDLKPELAEAFDITTTSGALIADITEGSPAAKAGLKRGDIIIAVGKRQVETSGDLRNRIGMNPPGTRVKITLIRKGREKSLPVQLGELPNTAKPNESETSFENDAGPLAGVELAPLGKERRRELGAEFKLGLGKDTPSGLVVLDLPAAGLAARGGLRAGDIILEANRRPIRSEQDLRGATRDDPGHLLLLVHRDGATIYLVLAG